MNSGAMNELKHILTFRVEVSAPVEIGATPDGARRVVPITEAIRMRTPSAELLHLIDRLCVSRGRRQREAVVPTIHEVL
jgi:hypothetical protein